jgi:hypothetical protein
LTVELEIRNREGPFSTLIRLGTSQPNVPEVELRLKYTTQPRIKIDPTFLVWSDVFPGEVLEKELVVITTLEDEGEGTDHPVIRSSSPAIKCRHMNSERRPGDPGIFPRAIHYFQVRVDSSPGQATLLNGTGALTLSFSDRSEVSPVQIPVTVHFRPHRWLVGPLSITMDTSPKTKPIRVRLWSRDGRAFELGRVSSSLPELQVTVVTKKPAKIHEIEIRLSSFFSGKTGTGAIRKGVVDAIPLGELENPYRLEVLLVPGRHG